MTLSEIVDMGDLPIRAMAYTGDLAALAACPLIACIPARDEAERIERCLQALDAELAPSDGIVLVANDCRDATVARAVAVTGGWRRPVVVIEISWRPGEGSAPLARKLAFAVAIAAAPEAILLSIDADTIVQPGLRAGYAAHFANGFDLVCGRIGFLPEEAALLPYADPASEAVISAYREKSREIVALFSPDPDNPWPHHGNIGGANFAMRGLAYRLAGSLPTPPFGEDRALRRRFEALDLRIRYADEPRVLTSCRLEGRAPGGLSEELKRNRAEVDPVVDELLEPPAALLRRCRARAALATACTAEARAAVLAGLELSADDVSRLAAMTPSLAFEAAERLSPLLRRRRLHLSDLRRHLPALELLLDATRNTPPDNPASRHAREG